MTFSGIPVQKDEVDVIFHLLNRLKTQLSIFRATNGHDAIDIINSRKVDILITDIQMPYMNGIELSRRARMISPSIEILFFSGYDDFKCAKEALSVNAVNYILKPVNPKEFDTSVQNALLRVTQRKKDFTEYESYIEDSFFHKEDNRKKEHSEDSGAEDSELLSDIKNAIRNRDAERLRENTEIILNKYSGSAKASHIYIRYIFTTLLKDLIDVLPEKTNADFEKAAEVIYQAADYERLRDFVSLYLEQVEKRFSFEKDSANYPVQVINQYICEHYSEDLNLQSLADQVFLSPKYLSDIFSQVKGISISKYIRDIRLKKAAESLDNEFSSYLDAMYILNWNDSLRAALSARYENNYDMYAAYKNVIDPAIDTIRGTNRSILSITIYCSNNLYPHGSYVKSFDEIKKSDWYKIAGYFDTVPKFYFSPDKKRLYLVCEQYYSHTHDAPVICMTIDTSGLTSALSTIYDTPYGFRIYSAPDSTPVWSYETYALPNVQSLDIKSLSEINKPLFQSSYILSSMTLSSARWTVLLYKPFSYSHLLKNLSAALVIMMFTFLLITATSILFSDKITKPIHALALNMKEIENNNLTILVHTDSRDEIGQLIISFQHMVKKLQYLINEVLVNKLAKKDYELRALQAQINPHFLYNSLSVINSKAILCGEDSISEMAQYLSTFYRTTLNKGNSFTTVRGEMSNITSYISIQKIMHSDLFEYVENIDKSLYDIPIPNLILQPLVENCILHGLMHKQTPGRGILTIEAYKKEDNLYFKVMDNGCGIERDICHNILNLKQNGYGVSNVHHRIQLVYGDDYGLSYTSRKDAGTAVLVRLKTSIPDPLATSGIQ